MPLAPFELKIQTGVEPRDQEGTPKGRNGKVSKELKARIKAQDEVFKVITQIIK